MTRYTDVMFESSEISAAPFSENHDHMFDVTIPSRLQRIEITISPPEEIICGFPMGPEDFKDCRSTNND